ncbi:MAG: DUF3459 domain-containing protein, partial [Acidimicrobiaceae bacterium]|nr:DUF3459 domain-containing protein [Acidimicrobiaceae bacterium]
DLEGIRRHLDHLEWLGVDALWLCPFYPSPMADFGYDVADYRDVDPLFGDLSVFDQLLADVHRRGMRLIVDWVPNHTSDRHPWFVEARSSRRARTRSWYYWRDDRADDDGGSGPPGSPGRLPNNWRAAFTGVGGREFPPAWTWDEATSQWYLHLFLPQQPDVNWAQPELQAAMKEMLRFWLERGVDGFRVDVVHALGKEPKLLDQPPELAAIPRAGTNDDPRTHPIMADLRAWLDEWKGGGQARVLVGEVYLPRSEQIVRYYGSPDAPELHLAFNFPPMWAPWDASAWRNHVQEVETRYGAAGAWPTWVLSSHDQSRHRTRYGSEARARAAAVLLLGLRGTPFLFAGEELGLADAVVPLARQVDPGGRDGCRAPLPWDASPAHGWAGGPTAWLPWPPGADGGATVADQRDDPTSTLHLYRRLLAARRGSVALRTGEFSWVPSDASVLAWARTEGSDARVVAVNFADEPADVEIPSGHWRVEVATTDDRKKTSVGSGKFTLAPTEALVLEPGS